MILVALYSIIFFNYESKDIIIKSSVIYPFTDPADAIYLNRTGDPHLNFKLYVNDVSYDNDDNPYGQLLYHMYTNMENINDTDKKSSPEGYQDKIVPLVQCNVETEFDWSDGVVREYCPQFTDTDFFYGNWYSKRFAWSRLALHFCDDSPGAEKKRKEAGKKHVKCKSKDEIQSFFKKTIVNLDV